MGVNVNDNLDNTVMPVYFSEVNYLLILSLVINWWLVYCAS